VVRKIGYYSKLIMNIYTKLTLLCLFLVFFTSLTLLYFAREESGNALKEVISDKLFLKASKSIGSIDRFLYERLQDMRFMATDPILKNPSVSQQAIKLRLHELKSLDQMTESLSFFDANRVRLADTEGLEVGKQHSLSKYWIKLANTDLAFDISKSESLNRIVIHFATHIRDENGRKVGTLVSRILIDRLYEVFETLDKLISTNEMHIDLLDSEQILIYSNHQQKSLLKKMKLPDGIHKKNKIIQDQDTLRLLVFQEGYMDFEGENWALIVSVPKSSAFEAQEKLSQKIVYILVPVLTIAIFISLFVAKRFSNPIRVLSEAAYEIGAGNLDTPILVNKKDEIGVLAKNFKKMAINLKFKMNELNESNLRLNQLNLKMEEKYQKIIRQKHKIEQQKQRIEQQNNLLNEAFKEIEYKNKSITSSILYAERIQMAILPQKQVLFNAFPNSFILDLPKDIVSGDFYWFDDIVFEQQNYFVLAVADCTGHGVPGGFMSILGSNLLTSIIEGEIVKSPSKILLALNQGIKKALHQEEYMEKNQDGMDVALCVINKESLELNFAGAHRPLYKLSGQELTEYKGDKYTMGGINFRLHKSGEKLSKMNEYKIDLQKGDRFYLFSDGFKDQMGQQEGRLYSTRRFKQSLTDLQDKNIALHGGLLHTELDTWKGANKQTDDILIVGFEV